VAVPRLERLRAVNLLNDMGEDAVNGTGRCWILMSGFKVNDLVDSICFVLLLRGYEFPICFQFVGGLGWWCSILSLLNWLERGRGRERERERDRVRG